MPAADSAPGECFSVARNRLLHHTAVSFVSSEISLGAAAPAGASQLPPPANTSVDIGAVATSPVTAARKRKGRGKGTNVARDERKHQRRVAFLLTTQGNTEAGT